MNDTIGINASISIGPNLRKSTYFDATLRDGVKGFSVYNHMLIPDHFGDPDGDYDRLINGVAMWDVAAQRQVQLEGPDAGRLAQGDRPARPNPIPFICARKAVI